MLSRALIFLFILFTSAISFASQCLMAEALKDPKLAQNGKFWEEYGNLAAKGEVPYDQMKALIEKHGGASKSAVPEAKVVQKSLDLKISHKATKEIKALPQDLHKKYDEFLEIALKPGGIQELYSNPGRWHAEKLHVDGTHTIRLDGGYRVNFEKNGDTLEVIRVNADQIHKK